MHPQREHNSEGWETVRVLARTVGVDGSVIVQAATRAQTSADQVIEAFHRAAVLRAWYDERELEAPFEHFESLPPGAFDSRIFDQEVWWVDILRRPFRVVFPAQFTDEHLRHVLAFLENRCATFRLQYCETFPDRAVPEDEHAWLESRVLVRALREQASMRHL